MAKQGSGAEAKEVLSKSVATKGRQAQRNNVVLLEACSNGKLNYIKTSIDAGADVHYVTEDNETPLLRCCTLSTAEAEKCIKYLMKRGVDTNFQDKYGRTALSYVAERGNCAMVDVLITSGDADPTLEDVKGNTPLMYAVIAGSVDIVSTIVGYFLVVNHPIDKRNYVGNTPLLLAARTGRFECAQILVEVGNANLHLRDLSFRSAVDWIRYTCPDQLSEFIALDPILVRKHDCSLRRHRTEKRQYRVLADFFPEGKMPSCWRSSGSKGTNNEPRKHKINKTICIFSDEKEPDPTEETDVLDDTIDTILHTITSEPSPLPPLIVPRSMFDIPKVSDIRITEVVGRFSEKEYGGKFVVRCDSSMSCVSAPSPTLPNIEDAVVEGVINAHRDEGVEIPRPERRKSIDNSNLLSRPQVQSPVVISRRVTIARSNTLPVKPRTPTDSKKNRQSTDPLKNARLPADPLKNARLPADAMRSGSKIATNPLSSAKLSRSGRQCKERKTSLPSISKNKLPFVHT